MAESTKASFLTYYLPPLLTFTQTAQTEGKVTQGFLQKWRLGKLALRGGAFLIAIGKRLTGP